MAKGYFSRLAAPLANVPLLVPGRAGLFAAPILPAPLEASRGAQFDFPTSSATASRVVSATGPAFREADAPPPNAQSESLPRRFKDVESEAMQPAATRAMPARDGSAIDIFNRDFGAPVQGLVPSPRNRAPSVEPNAKAKSLPARRPDEVVQWDDLASSQAPPAQTARTADDKPPAPDLGPSRVLETPPGINISPPRLRGAAAVSPGQQLSPERAPGRDTALLPAIVPVPPPREAREAPATPPRLEIGVIEVRAAPPPAPAPPAAPARLRAPAAPRAGLAQRHGWRYGFAQS